MEQLAAFRVLGAPQSGEGFSQIFAVIHYYCYCTINNEMTELLKDSAETAQIAKTVLL